MKTKLFHAACLSLAVFIAGCTTAGAPDIARISLAVSEAARIGTTEALRDRPEWRPGFVAARDQLNILGVKDKLTVADLLDAISRLPVSELSSDTARLAFEGARLTIAIAGWSDVAVVQTEQVRPVVLALASGISTGLTPAVDVTASRAMSPNTTKNHYRAK